MKREMRNKEFSRKDYELGIKFALKYECFFSIIKLVSARTQSISIHSIHSIHFYAVRIKVRIKKILIRFNLFLFAGEEVSRSQ